MTPIWFVNRNEDQARRAVVLGEVEEDYDGEDGDEKDKDGKVNLREAVGKLRTIRA